MLQATYSYRRLKLGGFGLLFLIVSAFLGCRNQEEWQPLRKMQIIESVYGVGQVASRQVFQLKVGVVTTIEALEVREGEQVKKGQALIKLSYPIQAPFSGTVTSLPFHLGENVSPGVPIITLMDLQALYLNVGLVQRGALRVRQGQRAKIGFEELPNRVFEGVVRSIYPLEGSFNARIDLDGLPEQVLPGMTADVAIEVSEPREALVAPLAALNNERITVKTEAGQETIQVQLGYVGSDYAEVVEPSLDAGQMVRLER